MKKCVYCNTEEAPVEGAEPKELPKQRICWNCKSPLDEDDMFCPQCGLDLRK